MANIKPCSNYTIPRLQKSCWVSQTGSGGFWRSHAPVERPARRCHRWSTLRSFDLCARRSTRCLTNIQHQCTTSHIRVVGTQITNKYKIWTTGMGSEKHTLGPIGDHLTHFLESLKAVTGSRWCVQSLSNVVRSRCYICSMPTKKYTFNKNIWTYYTTENKMTYITYAPIFEYLSYHHPESCIYIYISLPWISSNHIYGYGGYREL